MSTNFFELIGNATDKLFVELEENQENFGFNRFQYHLCEQGELNLCSHLARILDRESNLVITTEYSFNAKKRADLLIKDLMSKEICLLEFKFHSSSPQSPKEIWKKDKNDHKYYDKHIPQLKSYYDELLKDVFRPVKTIHAGIIGFEVAYFKEGEWENPNSSWLEKDQTDILKTDFYKFEVFKRNKTYINEERENEFQYVGLAIYGRITNQLKKLFGGVDCSKVVDDSNIDLGGQHKK